MASCGLVHVMFCILVSTYFTQARQIHKHKRNQTPSEDQDILNQPANSNQFQEWVLSRLGATEQRFNRKIQDINGKIRKVNRTVDIAHLEGMVYYTSEQQVLSEERGAARDSVVKNLENTISVQRTEIHHLKKRLGHLEETLINLTRRFDAGGQFTPKSTTAASASESSPSTSRLAGELVASSTEPTVDKNRPTTTEKPLPKDCEDAFRRGLVAGFDENMAEIKPFTSAQSFPVRCNVKRDEGWTVIQRRVDGSVDFFRNWQHYKNGFGQLEGEFWLGLQKIHEMTTQGNYKMRIEMIDWEGNNYWAEYDHFRVSHEGDFFRLHVHGYHGNAGDSLTSKWDNHSGQPFSTKDSDNDGRYYDNCAVKFKGAWWFTSCFESHLNGIYYRKGSHNNYFVRNGVQWNTIHVHSSLQSVEMMIRPNENVIEPNEEAGVLANNNNIE